MRFIGTDSERERERESKVGGKFKWKREIFPREEIRRQWRETDFPRSVGVKRFAEIVEEA